MDIQKTLLYAALFITSLMLWDAWHKDHAQTPAQQKVALSETGSPIPTQLNQEEPEAADTAIPQLETIIPSDRLVHVRTDVLDITIDTQGGNIVGAKLLDYSKEMHSKEPIEILNNKKSTLYLSQSGLLSEVGPDTNQALANYQVNQRSYRLAKGKNEIIVPLKWTNNRGVAVNKVFKFKRGEYLIDVVYQINNQSSKVWTGKSYTQLQRKAFEKKRAIFDFHTYIGASVSSPESKYEKLSFKKMRGQNLDRTVQGGWAAMQERYFLSAWIPNAEQSNHYYSHVSDDDIYTLGILSPTINVLPKNSKTVSAQFYVGPEIAKTLKAIAPGLDLTIDFGWLWFISIGIFWLMSQIYAFIGNWGVAIILVTLSIKLMFYHLSAKSYYSMANMRKLQPRVEALKQRHGEDKQKMGVALMELYKKEKVNPLGGCLPMLVQIPVFLSLYWVLIESVQLRHAPFMFWIQDLSSKDPFYVLPILMGASMLLQQKLSPPPPDPTQAKVMMLMPIFFTVLFLAFPAGLVLYWLVNNSLSILQQWYILQKVEKQSRKPAAGKRQRA